MTSIPQFSDPRPAAQNVLAESLSELANEANLLGSLLSSADESNTYFKMAAHLTEDHFTDSRHRRIWKAMCQLDKQSIGIDRNTLKAQLGTITPEGDRYLRDLIQHSGILHASYIKALERIELRRLYKVNLLKANAINDNRALTLEDASEQMSALFTEMLVKANAITGTQSRTVGELGIEFHKAYLDSDNSGIGIDTGYRDLNTLINGFEKKRVYVIAAETGGGKSILAQNISYNLNRGGHRGLFISLELPESEYTLRGLSHETGIDMNRIKQKCISKQEFALLGEATQRIAARAPLHMIYINRPTIAQLKTKIVELHQQGLDFVVIDYIAARMLTPGKDHRNDPIGLIGDLTQTLVDLAKKLNITIFSLAQISRDAYKRGGQPTKEDLGGTTAMGQDADAIFILKDEDPFSVSLGYGKTRLHIVKCRTGGEGQSIDFEARKHIFTFGSWQS